MKITEMCLPSDRGFRPKPFVKITDNGQMLIVLTCWGEPTDLDKVADDLLKTIEDLQVTQESATDQDTTRIRIQLDETQNSTTTVALPFEVVLRNSLQKLNQFLSHELNSKKWSTCIEATVVAHDHKFLYWAQCGQPQVFRTTSMGMEPLSFTPDPTLDMEQNIPLPFCSLGLEEPAQILMGYIPIGKTLNLILFSTPNIPSRLFHSAEISVDAIVEKIQSDNPHAPAWVAVIDFQPS